ncbi:phosphatidate cytidylyltransferase [Galbitalea sp. SE-J8]|uniref:phosphatidate cytidylyltransferase n=1 Tax=Galbitalea sp. SE-J8 TaxID=3054952 RepID=UPI00259CD4F4|nr:phosphatidate cytidylyltransferase [Galbitalea sp. SE-J8]MDM4762884.1 phosphatidate cytidylyltransferase [Galbitalea sp. SE-J8]
MSEGSGTPPGRRHPPSRAEIEANLHDFEARARATSDRINARSGRNLSLAIIVGLVLGAAVVASLIVVKEFFMLFGAALVTVTALELAGALRSAGRDVPRIPLVIASIGIVPLAFYGVPALGLTRDEGHWLGLLAAVVLVTVWRLVESVVPGRRVAARELGKDLLAGVFVLVYIVFLGSFAIVLVGNDGGQWWVLGFLIVVVSVDTGAYAAGLAFGRHKMAPMISPGKTWEGFAGSVVAATIAGILIAWLMLGQPWWVGIPLGLALVASATSGDLSESLIKRDLGIKDISTWLPGHGGVLDRLDSTMLSAPVAYALFLLFR